MGVLHWIAQAFSTYILHPLHGNGYQWHSGLGSDLQEITIIGLALGWWKHVNCHSRGCPRWGRFPVENTPFKVCRKHHPDVPDKRGVPQERIERMYQDRRP